MAKLEIPSIVVESGSIPPSAMDPPNRPPWPRDSKNSNDEETNKSESSDIDKNGAKFNGKKDTTANNGAPPKPKPKGNMRLLTRSYAIKESTSPPPDISSSPSSMSSAENVAIANNNNNVVTVNNNSNGEVETDQDDSTQGNDNNSSASLSRGNSTEQTTSCAMEHAELEQVIVEVLNKNTKDRQFLMKVENELVNLTKSPNRNGIKFGPMSSYQRMLVHKAADYFGMEHNVDSSGQNVLVSKTKKTRVPDIKFSNFLRDDITILVEPRRSILKRDSASFEDTTTFKSSHRHDAETLRRSKSYEEREEEYEKARRRIFHQEHGYNNQNSQDMENEYHDSQGWISKMWLTEESGDSSKLHPNFNRISRLKKVESYESKDTLKANSLRSSISKSYSFGGYDQNAQNNRVLTKQDSGSSMGSRVSPLSSGYKSQSLRSDTMSATPSPTATPHFITQLSSQSTISPEPQQPTVMWAVTNVGSIPAGSMLINPQSGEPFTNQDGSVYHYDPENPPRVVVESDLRPRYRSGNGAEQSSASQERDRTNSQPNQMPNIDNRERRPHAAMANQFEVNDAKHQSYQNHPQPPTPSNVIPPTGQPATVYAPGPSQVYSQPQQAPPPYCYGIPIPRYATAVVYTTTSSGAMPRSNDGSSLPRVVYVVPQFCSFPMAFMNAGGMAMPMMFGPTPPFPPAVPSNQAPPYGHRYAQNPPPSERIGVEVSFSQQPGPPLHAVYRFPQHPQLGAPAFYTTATNCVAPNCMMGYMQMPSGPMPPAPPGPPGRMYQHMPTPPNTPQNGGAAFPSYAAPMANYGHYQPGNVPLPPVLRPPMPLNIANGPSRLAARFNGPPRPMMNEQPNRPRPSIYRMPNHEVVVMYSPQRPTNGHSPGCSMRRRHRY